jgi:hypothetical protein
MRFAAQAGNAKTGRRNESGVFATHASTLLAVAGSVISARGPDRGRRHRRQLVAGAGFAKSGLDIRGADLSADQPV